MNSWKKVRLGDYIHEYSKRNKDNANIPVYSVTNTSGFCTEFFSKEVASKDKTTYKIVNKGFFAYNPSRINVGSVDWLRDMDRVIVSPLYNVFFVDDTLDQQYLYYYLKSPVGLFYINELASGSVRDNLKFSILSEFNIPFPDLTIQKDIAITIDRIVQTINICNKILKKIDSLVKSRFVEMFGDPVSNPMNWNKVAIGKHCHIITGNTPPRANEENYGSFIEWIKSDNINTPDTFLTKAGEYLSEKGASIGRCVESGSILMTCIAGSINCIGNVGVANRKVAFNQQINAIVPKFDETMYIYWLMILSKPYIQSTINMSLKGILSKGQLSVMDFPFPPLNLQRQFADFVEQTDKSKYCLVGEQILGKAEMLIELLNQEYFG